jgi:hypothetical protein
LGTRRPTVFKRGRARLWTGVNIKLKKKGNSRIT